MSRVEDLTFKWLDGEITETESAELARLVREDPDARAEHLALCDMESRLRGRLGTVDVAHRVMAEVAETARGHDGHRSGTTRRRRLRLSSSPWFRIAVAATLCVVGILAYRHTRPPDVIVPTRFLGPRVAYSDPGVSILSGGTRRSAGGGLPLRCGDMIETTVARILRLRYPDGTQVVVGPSTTATVGNAEGEETERKTIHLWHGALTAHVAEQPEGNPLTVTSPGAVAEVLGTRFRMSVEDAEARVDVIEGKVALTRQEDGASATVAAGQFAVSAPSVEPEAEPHPPRVREGLVALYGSDEGEGGTVHDRSGVEPSADLAVDKPGALRWSEDGVRLEDRAVFASSRPVSKLVTACRQSNEITVEAWVTPGTTDQIGPARIVTLSANTSVRNFTLGQDGYQDAWPPPGGTCYSFRLRTTHTTENGTPPAETPKGSVVTDLTHILATRTAQGAVRIYVDGVVRANHQAGGDLTAWGHEFRLAMGDEFTRDRPWLGTYHLVALYDRALTPDEVFRNYCVGPR